VGINRYLALLDLHIAYIRIVVFYDLESATWVSSLCVRRMHQYIVVSSTYTDTMTYSYDSHVTSHMGTPSANRVPLSIQRGKWVTATWVSSLCVTVREARAGSRYPG
jgi:type IV secretory pathway TraG/TraD family ATPase VirD4